MSDSSRPALQVPSESQQNESARTDSSEDLISLHNPPLSENESSSGEKSGPSRTPIKRKSRSTTKRVPASTLSRHTKLEYDDLFQALGKVSGQLSNEKLLRENAEGSLAQANSEIGQFQTRLDNTQAELDRVALERQQTTAQQQHMFEQQQRQIQQLCQDREKDREVQELQIRELRERMATPVTSSGPSVPLGPLTPNGLLSTVSSSMGAPVVGPSITRPQYRLPVGQYDSYAPQINSLFNNLPPTRYQGNSGAFRAPSTLNPSFHAQPRFGRLSTLPGTGLASQWLNKPPPIRQKSPVKKTHRGISFSQPPITAIFPPPVQIPDLPVQPSQSFGVRVDSVMASQPSTEVLNGPPIASYKLYCNETSGSNPPVSRQLPCSSQSTPGLKMSSS